MATPQIPLVDLPKSHRKASASIITPIPVKDAGAKPAAATAPAPEFEIVSVRKPDGTIAKFKRRTVPPSDNHGKPPASPKDISKNTAMEALNSSPPIKTVSETPSTSQKGSKAASDNTSAEATKTSHEPATYKIVTVKKPDGTIVRFKKPIADSTAQESTAQTTPAQAPVLPAVKTTKKPVSDPASKPALTPKNPAQQSPQGLSDAHPSQRPVTHGPNKDPEMLPAPTVAPRYATRGFQRLHMGISRMAGTLEPDWDNADIEEGDEIHEDNDAFSTDSDDSDDDKDKDTISYAGEHDEDRTRDDSTDRNDPTTQSHNNEGDDKKEDSAQKEGSTIPRRAPRKTTPGHREPFVAVPKDTSTGSKPDSNIEPNQQQPATKNRNKTYPVVTEKKISDDLGSDRAIIQRKPPRQLTSQVSILTVVMMSVITVALPILFIVLGIVTATLTGSSTGSYKGSVVDQATKVAISAWPIVFAAIAAQSLKALASYKVERGIRLMTLEQLISSHSVAGAIKQPFLLRRIDLVSIGLFFLWCLSPLAGQAMLRLSGSELQAHTFSDEAYYLNTTGFNMLLSDSYDRAGGLANYQMIFQTLYSSALLPKSLTSKNDTQDIFGHPIIPRIEDLEQYYPPVDGWIDLTKISYEDIFASFYGVPALNLTYLGPSDFEPSVVLETGQYEFVVQAAYLDFNCSSLTQANMTDILATGVKFNASESGTLFVSIEPLTTDLPGTLHLASSVNEPLTEGDSHTAYNVTMAYSVCTFQRTFVDTTMTCTSAARCQVTKLRRTSPKPDDIWPMAHFSSLFVNLSGFDNIGAPTVTERYLYDPVTVTTTGLGPFDLSKVPLEDFTRRLAKLVNTFWSIGFGPDYMLSTITQLSESDTTPKTPSHLTFSTSVYTTNWPWLAVLFFCSVVLLVAGAIGLFLESRTVGPNVLGFANTVLRQSKHVRMPKVGDGVMGGPERARLLADVKVMMQDVKKDSDVGKIALGTVHEGSRRLQKGRFYR